MFTLQERERKTPQIFPGDCRLCGYAHHGDAGEAAKCVDRGKRAEVLVALATEFVNLAEMIEWLTDPQQKGK